MPLQVAAARFRFYYLLLFGVIFLPWALPLNLLLNGTPLVIWKQGLALLLAFCAVRWVAAERRSAAIGCLTTYRNFFILVLFCLSCWFAVSFLGDGTSLTRCAYAVIAYVGFFTYLLLPVIASRCGKMPQLFTTVSIVGIACGAGLILDYFLNFSGLLYLVSGVDNPNAVLDRADTDLVRAAFPFESPSTGYGFLSLGILCTYVSYLRAGTASKRVLWLLGITVILLGGLLTASRAIWILFAVWLGAILISELGKGVLFTRMVPVALFLGVTIFLGDAVLSSSSQLNMLQERAESSLSESDEGNSKRYQFWAQGLDMMMELNTETFFGHGLGSTMGQISDGFNVHSHFESSFFQSYYEGGLAGLFVRYFGYLIALIGLSRGGSGNSRLNLFLVLWLALYFLGTSTSPTAGSYSGQLAFFFVVGLLNLGRASFAWRGNNQQLGAAGA